MWQIIVQIETHVKYEISAHVKGQNTSDKVLNDYVGRRDAMLCLDVNAGSCTETHFLLGSLCLTVITCIKRAPSDLNMVSVK